MYAPNYSGKWITINLIGSTRIYPGVFMQQEEAEESIKVLASTKAK